MTTTTETLTYEQGNGHSYFHDLARHAFDIETSERLRQHAADVRRDPRFSAGVINGESSMWTPPLWMIQAFDEDAPRVPVPDPARVLTFVGNQTLPYAIVVDPAPNDFDQTLFDAIASDLRTKLNGQNRRTRIGVRVLTETCGGQDIPEEQFAIFQLYVYELATKGEAK